MSRCHRGTISPAPVGGGTAAVGDRGDWEFEKVCIQRRSTKFGNEMIDFGMCKEAW